MDQYEKLSTRCNICGGLSWLDAKNRPGVLCAHCGSYERTRAVKIVLDRLGLPHYGHRVLHLAPEKGLSDILSNATGAGYEPADYEPSRYPHTTARRLDLVSDAQKLPSNYYDLILHNHVSEHVPCSLAYVLFHLHRALKPTGHHIFSIPIMSGCYDEYLGELPPEEATRRFGQFDHLRRFGREDIERHIGKMLHLDLDYSLYKFESSAANLDACNIPESERRGLNGSTVFVVGKFDYLLSSERDGSNEN